MRVRCSPSDSIPTTTTRASRSVAVAVSCRRGPPSTTACRGTDNLAYAAALFQVAPQQMDERIAEAASRFGISDALDQKVGGYSTGMRARLALARAVLHEPDLLLLDEPTAGLDPESARTVLGLIDEMAEDGKTVLMCTHLLLEAEGLADQVIVMDHGQAMISGSPRELTRQFWPAARVVLDADNPSVLDTAAELAVRTRVLAQRRGHRRARAGDRRPRSRRRTRRRGARLTRCRAAGAHARRAVLRHPPGAPVSRRPSTRQRARRGSSPAPTCGSCCRRATSGSRSRSSHSSSS